jgi:hypothetical protein
MRVHTFLPSIISSFSDSSPQLLKNIYLWFVLNVLKRRPDIKRNMKVFEFIQPTDYESVAVDGLSILICATYVFFKWLL